MKANLLVSVGHSDRTKTVRAVVLFGRGRFGPAYAEAVGHVRTAVAMTPDEARTVAAALVSTADALERRRLARSLKDASAFADNDSPDSRKRRKLVATIREFGEAASKRSAGGAT